MEKAVRRKYTDEFKEGAVKLVTDQGYKISEAARNLGINATQLRRWVKGKLPDSSPVPASMAQLQAELKLLRRENERLRMEREIPKKGHSLLRERIGLRFSFIDNEKKAYPLNVLCKVMQVSRSGYYHWKKRGPSAREQERTQLIPRVRGLHQESKATYGSRRIAQELKALGFRCGKHKAGTLMKLAGVAAKQRKRFKATTDSNHQLPVAPNLLNRRFSVTTPNCVWVGDITYVWTSEGWLYLAVVIDLYSRRIVGWSMNKCISRLLVMDALAMAIWRRKPPRGLIFHSDRGSQYCSHDFQKLLKNHGMLSSMSRKGDCWDNAVAESFFGSLKIEQIFGMRYLSRSVARQDIVDYIEMFYNSRRRHSSLGYMNPMEFEKQTLWKKAA
ncbi:MAG TPA: IS3 family transposase [Methylomicrobium sp.]|nr:IS3 family transposase [Methylomicrobium sp.]